MGLPDTVDRAADELVASLSPDVLNDLRTEDPALAIEIHYDDVRVQALPDHGFVRDACSTDGFYDTNLDPRTAWIFYAADVAPTRARFTLMHELGHHLVFTRFPSVIESLDRVARSGEHCSELEELVAHRFAGKVLIADADLDAVLGGAKVITPQHVIDLHERVRDIASLDAVAVRLAQAARGQTAITVIRDSGTIAFCATRGLESGNWPRGSSVAPNGPLSRALTTKQTARPETYRHGLSFAQVLHCDTLPVSERLAVAVLSDRPSDGSLNLLPSTEPAWKDRELFCEPCNAIRTEGWCDKCRGPHCPECTRCGCDPAPKSWPPCPECFRPNRINPGAQMCVECERDYG